MYKITKSRYVAYKTCPKSLWLSLFKSEVAKEDPTAQKHIDDGKEVGRVAKGYFKDTIDAPLRSGRVVNERIEWTKPSIINFLLI